MIIIELKVILEDVFQKITGIKYIFKYLIDIEQ